MASTDAPHHNERPASYASSLSSYSGAAFPLDDEEDNHDAGDDDQKQDYILPAVAYTAPSTSFRRPGFTTTASSDSITLNNNHNHTNTTLPSAGRAPPSFAAFRSKTPAKPPPFLHQTPILRRAGSLDAGLGSPALQEAFPVNASRQQQQQQPLQATRPLRSASLTNHIRHQVRPSSQGQAPDYRFNHQSPAKPFPLSPHFEEDAQFDGQTTSSPSEYDRDEVEDDYDNNLLHPGLDRSHESYHTARDSLSGASGNEEVTAAHASLARTMSSASRPSNLTVKVDGQQAQSESSPKSPAAKVTSFFGWKSSSKPDSPTTSFADSRDASRSPSPLSGGYRNGANFAEGDESYASGNVSPVVYSGQDGSSHVDELLRELKEVGVELASSIKREMDLEDEVDRYRVDMPNGPSDHNRRTSDYYSDSGASSIRLPGADSETKIEGLEKMRRKAEQEKAQLRIEMAQNVQEALNQRRALEMHVQSLEEQIKMQEFHASEPTEKERELTANLEDMKRRLSQERDHKQNLEDIFKVMKEEAEAHRSERDNLRDEVVPKLQSQLNGLESQSAEKETLTYENAKLQQEIQSLRNENQTLASARKLQLDTQHNLEGGLARSGSARSKSIRHRPSTSKDYLPTEALPERLEKVEEQRDALQRTLQALILRHNHMMKQQSKAIKDLTVERNKALSYTPRRAAFQLEVQHLRKEIDHLRRRADDAFEAKFQCEKGLSGLRMDLERAQQETSSLRELLAQREVFIPLESVSAASTPSDSEDLNKSYASLRNMHADYFSKLKAGGSTSDNLVKDAEVRMSALSQQVQSQVNSNEELRARLAQAIERGETEQKSSTQKIMDLESTLRSAEEKVIAAQTASEEALSQHEEHIKEMNEAEGEQTQRKVTSPLKIFTPVSGSATKSNNHLSPESAKNPSMFGPRSPRLDVTTSGKGQSASEASKIAALEDKVKELETAAGQAEREMQDVVSRMNMAQIEVAELQTERDEAIRQTRRLQKSIKEEKERVKAIAG